MPVTAQPALVAPGLGEGLTERDADVFHRVVGVDFKVAVGLDIEIDKAVAGYLIEHVIEKRQAAGEATFAASVEVYADRDLRFFGVTLYAGDAFVHCH